MRFLSFLGLTMVAISACRQAEKKPEATEQGRAEPEFEVVEVMRLHNDAGQLYAFQEAPKIVDTIIGGSQELKISGEVFLDIKNRSYPYFVRTRLMDIEVREPASFLLSAFDEDRGQSIEMLQGFLIVRKAYTSPFPEPDTLRGEALYMINDDIDLSEVEKLDNELLRQWWQKTVSNL